MHQMKSAASTTASLEYFQGFPASLDRPLSAILGSRRRILLFSGLLSLPVLIFAVAALGWFPSSAKPSPQPLSGTWNCSLAGEPIGVLSVNGWNYVLGPNQAGDQTVGTLKLVVYPGKYRQEFIRVPSGTLKDKFGIKLGFHYDIAEPEMLVFNIGPGSGIRCTRT